MNEMYVCHVCMHVTYGCLYACMYVMHVMYVCNICMYVCNVCMSVCMYVLCRGHCDYRRCCGGCFGGARGLGLRCGRVAIGDVR